MLSTPYVVTSHTRISHSAEERIIEGVERWAMGDAHLLETVYDLDGNIVGRREDILKHGFLYIRSAFDDPDVYEPWRTLDPGRGLQPEPLTPCLPDASPGVSGTAGFSLQPDNGIHLYYTQDTGDLSRKGRILG